MRRTLKVVDLGTRQAGSLGDFLEHLPGIGDSNDVLEAMLDHAVKGVWLRMPSFEQDEEGEGQLRQHGLKFTWTHWHAHPSFYKVSDALGVINRIPPDCRTERRHRRVICNSSSQRELLRMKVRNRFHDKRAREPRDIDDVHSSNLERASSFAFEPQSRQVPPFPVGGDNSFGWDDAGLGRL